MNVLSLFSGIGAFERALSELRVSYNLVAFCEKDNKAIQSYCAIHNVSSALNIGDITKAKPSEIKQRVNLITYGFPCQDLSCSGKQAGLHKGGKRTRSGLFFDALCFIDKLKPEIAVAENVKNLVSAKFQNEFNTILNSLTAVGYNNYYFVLNAVDFGVPQNRERLFIVSIRKDIDKGLFVAPKSVGGSPKCLECYLEQNIAEKYWISSWGGNIKSNATLRYAITAAAMRGRPVDGKNVQQIEISDRPYANTITTVAKDCLLCYHTRKQQNKPYIRRLSGIEAFRLMGFTSDDYSKANQVNTESTLYKQAGNSIVVPVAKAVFQSVLRTGILNNT